MHTGNAAADGRGSHLQAVEGGKELDRLIRHAAENNKFFESALDELDMLANRLGMYPPPSTGELRDGRDQPQASGALPILFAELGRATEIGVRLRGVIERLQRVA